MANIFCLTLNPAIDLSLSVDALRPGSVHRCGPAQSDAAGKGVNVAQALTDLGHDITVGGFLGAENSASFERLFAARAWHDVFVRVAGETRINVKVGEASGRHTDFNTSGFVVSEVDIARLAEQTLALAAAFDAVVVAGSLPRGFAPAALGKWLAALRARNPRLVLDTSGEALKEGVGIRPWLIKPNAEELAELGQTGAALHDAGIEHVLVSDGAAGVTWYGPSGVVHATPPPVPVVSTVGAGDTLVAGMVHALLDARPATDALRFATACGSYAVTRIGFGLKDVDALAAIESGVHVTNKTGNEAGATRGNE